VPTISSFYGITVRIHWNEHMPPHFHVRYAEWKASIVIETLAVMKGRMPRRALALVLEWAAEHRAALMENWQLCAEKLPPRKIPGLK
jgi:hypothetical protein